jgi:hypothetical protein
MQPPEALDLGELTIQGTGTEASPRRTVGGSDRTLGHKREGARSGRRRLLFT